MFNSPDRNDHDEYRFADITPGVITRLTPLRRLPGRFSVEIDGRSGLTLAEEVLLRSGLQVGDVIDAEALAAVTDQDILARATESALVYLAYRPRTEQEVRTRLRRAGHAPEVIAQVMAKLHEWRYLDDVDFARRWVESRTAQKPRGKRLLQQELRQKGVAAETAREVIADAGVDEAAAAEALARKRLASYAGDDPQAVRRKLSAYLARRGYGYDIVRGAIERVLVEEDAAAEPGDHAS
jgi:regulatory protein